MLNDLFDTIENSDFIANLMVMSGVEHQQGIQLVLQHSPVVNNLVNMMALSEDTCQHVRDRLVMLLNVETPSGYSYLNNYDYSITAYLYALYTVDNTLGIAASELIVTHQALHHNLRWAYRYAIVILDTPI